MIKRNNRKDGFLPVLQTPQPRPELDRIGRQVAVQTYSRFGRTGRAAAVLKYSRVIFRVDDRQILSGCIALDQVKERQRDH
jgi:hypothetical protein